MKGVKRAQGGLFACLLAIASPAIGQANRPLTLEVLAGPTYWHANRSAWGIHGGVGVRGPGELRQVSLSAYGFHGPARGDSTTPGVTSFEVEAALALARVGPGRPNVFLSFAAGRTHFDGTRQEVVLARCTPETFCMTEGVTVFRTGTSWTWIPGLGAEIPLSSFLALKPHLRALVPHSTENNARAMARLDLGVRLRMR